MCVHVCAKQACQKVGVPLRYILVIKYNDTHMKDINTIIIFVFGVKAKGYVNLKTTDLPQVTDKLFT
jgi:hypothetical protein